MLRLDFSLHKEPFDFIQKGMKGNTPEKIQRVHDWYCRILNLRVKKHNYDFYGIEFDDPRYNDIMDIHGLENDLD